PRRRRLAARAGLHRQRHRRRYPEHRLTIGVSRLPSLPRPPLWERRKSRRGPLRPFRNAACSRRVLSYTPCQYLGSTPGHPMPHSPADKKKALARVRRIRGQLDALERALEAGADCAPVLQQLAAVRGAVNGLMSEVLESHLREEFAQPDTPGKRREAGIDAAVALVRSYLK